MVMAIFFIVVGVAFMLTVFKCIDISREFNAIKPAERVPVEDDEAELEFDDDSQELDDEVLQAEFDRQFIVSQLTEYETLYREAMANRDRAIRDCDWDAEQMKKQGSAITEKIATLHKKEREKYRKQCLKYASTIHALENRLAKVENIINNG